MSSRSYRIKFDDKTIDELSVKIPDIRTIGDLKAMIVKHSKQSKDLIALWINGKEEVEDDDSTSLGHLSLDNFKYFKVYERSKEVEQGAVSRPWKQVQHIEEKKDSRDTEIRREQISNIEPSILTEPKPKKKKEEEEEKEKAKKISANIEASDSVSYRVRELQMKRPESQWIARENIPLKESQKEDQKIEKPSQQIPMDRGDEAKIKHYMGNIKGPKLSPEALKHFEIKWIKIIIKHYMSCDALKAYKEKLLTEYGLIDFLLPKIVESYPALKLMQEDRKKMFYEMATEEWFYGEKIERDENGEKAYIDSLSEHTNEAIIEQIERVTHDRSKARQIVEISQNQFDVALKMALGEKVDLKSLGFFQIFPKQLQEVPLLKEWQQQPFLFVWLMGKENYPLRLKIFADINYLKVYTLSIKHQSYELFQLLVKHRTYILKILAKRPPQLHKQKPEF